MDLKHINFMKLALSEAKKAGKKNEIPIGSAELVAGRFKMLAYRGKMPLPLFSMRCGSGFQPRIMVMICYF
jgi:hypothetical protein